MPYFFARQNFGRGFLATIFEMAGRQGLINQPLGSKRK
jgi:hypothetical protein